MSDSRSRIRRTGLISLALAGVSTGVALWAADRFHLGLATTAVTVLFALTPLYQSWASYRADREDADSTPEWEQRAEALAHAVRRQWEAESGLRRLNDPYSMPVSWQAAPVDLVESLSRLRAVAAGWPGGASAAETEWAVDEDELSGTGGQIGDVLSRLVPTKRLVVLGEPGSGKTVLLMRLVLDLLARRERNSGDRLVPVLFPMASWNPAREDLVTWLERRLLLDYPALAEPSLMQDVRMSTARALMERGLIFPVLDGLDELPHALQAEALATINRTLPLGQGMVLSSRIAEYREATRIAFGLSIKLAGAAGIELRPVQPDDAAAYLLGDSGDGPEAERRWRAVVGRLGSQAPVGRALRTPLMLFLASTIYNPRPGENWSAIPDPSELCDPNTMVTPHDIESHLFDAFLPAAYRARPGQAHRWTAEEAEAAFVYLARHLQHDLGGTPDLAWWQLPQSTYGFLSRIKGCATTGLLAGLLAGCSAVGFGWPGCLVAGWSIGILVMLTISVSRPEPADRVRWSWSWPRLVIGAALGTIFGLDVFPALTAMSGGDGSASGNLSDGAVTGAVIGLLSVLTASGKSRKADIATAVGSAALLALDRRSYRNLAILGTGVGLIVWVPVYLALAWISGPPVLDFAIAEGLLVAPVFGLTFASARTAWGAFTVTRWKLALTGKTPRDLMAFLADAHERRGVLRQVGAAYQFRHIDLQHRLAQRA